jgi:hypothetical protein
MERQKGKDIDLKKNPVDWTSVSPIFFRELEK